MLDSAAESDACWGKRYQENRAGRWTTYSGTTCLICGFTYPSAAFAAGEKSNVNRSPGDSSLRNPSFLGLGQSHLILTQDMTWHVTFLSAGRPAGGLQH